MTTKKYNIYSKNLNNTSSQTSKLIQIIPNKTSKTLIEMSDLIFLGCVVYNNKLLP